ncbi:MAG: MFS transporter [Candidatus Coatesbacteria bacterium]|nr:MAG: MFS transporter [Candidatus Coatesbacteria bacterium]HEC80376.1 MFS transporter [Bacillota bacterium]
MKIYLKKDTLSWILYDFANTIYSMNIVSLYFSQWFIIDLGEKDIVYSIAFSISLIINGLTMPAIGALCDARASKHTMLTLFTILCCVSTALIGIMGNLNPLLITSIIGLFIIANFAYNASQALYNALLSSVTTPDNYGRVSGWGVALGYAGSILGMLAVLPFVKAGGRISAFLPTGALFLALSIPAFLFVRDKATPREESINIGLAYRKVINTLKKTRRYPGLLRFLIAKAFYEDGIATAILFMAVYAQQVMGMSDEVKVPFFIVSTTFAIIGSVVFGYITDRLGPKKTLIIVITGWVICLVFISIIKTTLLFWLIGAVVGIFLGATWTSSRPLLLKLVPAGMEGEAFGLYSLSGKVAAIIGPLLFGGVVLIAEPLGAVKYRIGVISLAVMMTVGLIILLGVKEKQILQYKS